MRPRVTIYAARWQRPTSPISCGSTTLGRRVSRSRHLLPKRRSSAPDEPPSGIEHLADDPAQVLFAIGFAQEPEVRPVIAAVGAVVGKARGQHDLDVRPARADGVGDVVTARSAG